MSKPSTRPARPETGWKRPRGRPRARWSDQIVRLSGLGTLNHALEAAQDRALWRGVVRARYALTALAPDDEQIIQSQFCLISLHMHFIV